MISLACVMTVQQPLAVQHPSVWTATHQQAKESEWCYHLSSTDLAEIDAALRHVQAKALALTVRALTVSRCCKSGYPRISLPSLAPFCRTSLKMIFSFLHSVPNSESLLPKLLMDAASRLSRECQSIDTLLPRAPPCIGV